MGSPARSKADTLPTAYGEQFEAMKEPFEGTEQSSGSLSQNLDRKYYQALQDQRQKRIEHHRVLMEHHQTVQALFKSLQDSQQSMQNYEQALHNYHRELRIHHQMIEEHHQMMKGMTKNHPSHQELQ